MTYNIHKKITYTFCKCHRKDGRKAFAGSSSMNRPVFTKCMMVKNKRVRIARAINYCLNAARSIAHTSRARSSAVSKWADLCVYTANYVQSVASRNAVAAVSIASTANNVQSVASRSAAAAARIASTANYVHSVASRNAVAAARIASTAHDVHCVASRSVAAAASIASTAHDVHSAASLSAAAVDRIANTSRVTVRRNSATIAIYVPRKGTLHAYADNDDTGRSKARARINRHTRSTISVCL